MNLHAWIISKAWYDDLGVGYSKLIEQFPHVPGPLAPYDTLTDLRKPWGRHPVTGDPLLVIEVDRWTSEIVTPGVMSQSALITPGVDTVPAVTVTGAIVYDFATTTSIHQHAQHLVLALETVDGSEPPIEGWGKDDGFTASQWLQYRNPLVTLGIEAAVIDNWRTNNPDATRRAFYFAFRNFINNQG